MKIILRNFLTVFCLVFPFIAKTQSLQIGQKVPDLLLRHVLNYEDTSLRLSKLKGKAIILDFWGTNCPSCIIAFPKMEALQKQFRDRLQVVLVNDQDLDSTKRFFANRSKIPFPQLPMITGDTILQQLFPRNYLPWHVWIDADGTVSHITDAWNATDANVKDFLNKKTLSITNHEYIADFDYNVPFFAEGKGRWLDKVEKYSFISRCVLGASAGWGNGPVPGNDSSYRIARNCESIVDLLKAAFSEGGKYNLEPRSTVILEVQDTFRYVVPKDSKDWDRWYVQNSYSYNIKVPIKQAATVYNAMQGDLMQFFNLTATIEKRKIPCMVLIRTDRQDKLRTKGGEAFSNLLMDSENPVKQIRNMPFSELSIILRIRFENPAVSKPFVDATGYKGNIDLQFDAETWQDFNVPELRIALQKYGLDLIEKEWITDILVIREKP